jgi:uncharacterized protein
VSEMLADIEDVLRPRTDADARAAVQAFLAAVQARYGDDLKGMYLFGSRARGEHRPDSDVDIAVIFEDGPWRSVGRSIELAELAFEPLVQTGIDIQPRAVPASHWENPSLDIEAALLHRLKTDAKPLSALP